MDVDVAGEGVGIAGFTAAEPEDAGDDGIAAWRIDGNDLARGATAFEFHARGLASADLLGDLQAAQRGAVGAGNVTESELGGGDGEGGEQLVAPKHSQALIGNGNQDAVLVVGAGGKQKEEQGREPDADAEVKRVIRAGARHGLGKTGACRDSLQAWKRGTC